MPSIFDTKDPLAAAYLARNPTSILGMAAAAAMRMKNQAQVSNNVAGSNNAGGLAPASTPNSQSGFGMSRAPTGGFNFGGQSQGIYRSSNADNSMGGTMPQISDPVGNGSMFGGSIVSFAEGGMMAPSGAPIRPGDGMMPSGGPALGAASPAPMNSAQIDQEAQRFVQQHPQEVQKIQEVIAVAMQMGELTSEELNMAVQLAKTALARPESYPQIRQFAIQNGLGTEQDIPQQMDQGLLYVLIVAGKSMQNSAPPSGNAMQGQGPSPTQNSVVPEYSDGGMTGDKPHIAKLHAREYVIPEDALIYHGKKHFDKLVEQARTPPDAGTN